MYVETFIPLELLARGKNRRDFNTVGSAKPLVTILILSHRACITNQKHQTPHVLRQHLSVDSGRSIVLAWKNPKYARYGENQKMENQRKGKLTLILRAIIQTSWEQSWKKWSQRSQSSSVSLAFRIWIVGITGTAEDDRVYILTCVRLVKKYVSKSV